MARLATLPGGERTNDDAEAGNDDAEEGGDAGDDGGNYLNVNHAGTAIAETALGSPHSTYGPSGANVDDDDFEC